MLVAPGGIGQTGCHCFSSGPRSNDVPGGTVAFSCSWPGWGASLDRHARRQRATGAGREGHHPARRAGPDREPPRTGVALAATDGRAARLLVDVTTTSGSWPPRPAPRRAPSSRRAPPSIRSLPMRGSGRACGRGRRLPRGVAPRGARSRTCPEARPPEALKVIDEGGPLGFVVSSTNKLHAETGGHAAAVPPGGLRVRRSARR